METTHRIGEIEIVFCVDEDDAESHCISFEPLTIKTVIVGPGATMGELNRKCFEISTGRFVMLANDDVVLRTKNWDREVYSAFASFGDDIGLVHVNDLLFRDKLCTFPILSRQACLEIGVCPSEYRRYRIDDHIYDTYNILAFLGYRRIVYLPQVIFEHLNHQTTSAGERQKFVSEDNKVYVPIPEILEFDARLFDSWTESRKQDAMKLAMLIEQLALEKRRLDSVERLKNVKDQFSYRRANFVRIIPPSASSEPAKNAVVTVAVVTSDVYKPHAQKCLSLLKKHTSHFDLIVFDNNGSKDFNHPREMNRAIRTAQTDFLVLIDDDVLVEQGWLDGLLESIDAETGVVSPLHKDKDGNISHSGVGLMGDDWGSHAHLVDVPDEPRVAQCLCSACLLIDLRKTRGIFFNERYSKYFHDLDHSLQVWEAGYKVVCTPRSIVTHLGGATMPHGSAESTSLWNRDIQIFAADWIRSGRLERLTRGMFSKFPFLLLMGYVPRRIRSVLAEDSWEFSGFAAEVQELESICARLPLFKSLLVQEVASCLARCRNRGDSLKAEFCEDVMDRLKHVSVRSSGPVPVLIGSYRGHNLVQYLDDVLVVPQSLGSLNLSNRQDRERPEIFSASNIEAAKTSIDDMLGYEDLSDESLAPVPVLTESYKGYNLVRYIDQILAVPISLGIVNLATRQDRERPEIITAASLENAKSAVDAMIGRNGDLSFSSSCPVLLQTYKDHNLVRFNGKICAVPLSLGHVDLTEETIRCTPHILTAGSIDEAKMRLDRTRAETTSLSPFSSQERGEARLIHQGYKRFNLILYGEKYYAILQSDGAFDPVRIPANSYTCIFAADTLNDLKSRIDGIPLIWHLAFRLKPILVNHPVLWRTAQKLKYTLTHGGVE